MKYIILGSGIAGKAAAEAIRKRDQEAGILMISAEKELCFNRPMLIKEFALDGSGAALFELQQDWPKQENIEVRLGTRVTAIDTRNKVIRTGSRVVCSGEEALPSEDETLRSGGETFYYDKLIYALGAEVTIPPIPGVQQNHVHVVRTREDMKHIRETMRGAKHAVVIGGGMLGLEDAWGLHQEKLDVTIIEQKQRLAFGQIDQSAGNLMKKRIERMGVKVYVNTDVIEIGSDSVTFMQRHSAQDGETAETAELAETEPVTIPADLVILSTGVTPNSALGEAAGLATSGQGRATGRWIAVDEYCRTSDPDVFAAGDVAAVNGRNDAIWDEAQEMGRVAGTNAAITAELECLNERLVSSDANASTEGKASAEELKAELTVELTAEMAVYRPVTAEHVFTGFDTEVFTMADSSGAGTDGVYIRHADVEIFDYQRERYIRVSLQDGIIAGILLINASELAPELMEAYHAGAGEEEARQIILRWKKSHDVDFKPAAPFTHRGVSRR